MVQVQNENLLVEREGLGGAGDRAGSDRGSWMTRPVAPCPTERVRFGHRVADRTASRARRSGARPMRGLAVAGPDAFGYPARLRAGGGVARGLSGPSIGRRRRRHQHGRGARGRRRGTVRKARAKTLTTPDPSVGDRDRAIAEVGADRAGRPDRHRHDPRDERDRATPRTPAGSGASARITRHHGDPAAARTGPPELVGALETTTADRPWRDRGGRSTGVPIDREEILRFGSSAPQPRSGRSDRGDRHVLADRDDEQERAAEAPWRESPTCPSRAVTRFRWARAARARERGDPQRSPGRGDRRGVDRGSEARRRRGPARRAPPCLTQNDGTVMRPRVGTTAAGADDRQRPVEQSSRRRRAHRPHGLPRRRYRRDDDRRRRAQTGLSEGIGDRGYRGRWGPHQLPDARPRLGRRGVAARSWRETGGSARAAFRSAPISSGEPSCSAARDTDAVPMPPSRPGRTRIGTDPGKGGGRDDLAPALAEADRRVADAIRRGSAPREPEPIDVVVRRRWERCC